MSKKTRNVSVNYEYPTKLQSPSVGHECLSLKTGNVQNLLMSKKTINVWVNNECLR